MFEEIDADRRRFLGAAAMTIAASQFGSLASATTQSGLSPLGRATAWLNSPPLTDAELRRKVVLVEFWTYSCINWRRQLPYVRAWAEKYKDLGLAVIGVHSPEFSFEKDIGNIRDVSIDLRPEALRIGARILTNVGKKQLVESGSLGAVGTGRRA